MATLTVYAGSADGELRSNNATYLTARSGGGTFVTNTTATTGTTGQEFFNSQYYVYELFWGFDTSSLGASANISSALLDLYAWSRNTSGSSAFTNEVRLHDWGGTVTTADWVAGADMSSKTLLCSIDESVIVSGGQNKYYTLTDVAFAANVNKTGTTYVFCSSSRTRNANVPTSQEYQLFVMANAAGTTQDPKLVVTYTTYTPQDPLGRMGFFGI